MRGAYPNELYHHGIKGQKWYVRRFQNEDGSLTPAGVKRYNKGVELLRKKSEKSARKEGLSKEEAKKRSEKDVKNVPIDEAFDAYKKHKQKVDAIVAGAAVVTVASAVAIARHKIGVNEQNTAEAKRNVDRVLKKNTVMSTLSVDPNRTSDTDMFYAAHTKLDKQQYRALFGEAVDESTHKKIMKVSINNKLVKNVKIASEKAGVEHFNNLLKSDDDFKDFVLNKDRMESYFVKSKYKFKGYREAKKALDEAREAGEIDKKKAATIYRLYNYVIPNNTSDVISQRGKFFGALKNSGYGAVLDTNDALYGGFKASSPIIMFDMESIVPKSVKKLTTRDKRYAGLVLTGRKMMGV